MSKKLSLHVNTIYKVFVLCIFGIGETLYMKTCIFTSFDRQNGQPIRVLVGVVIQEMVKSEVSGVLFTNHPVTGSADHMVIDASYGLGEVRKITIFYSKIEMFYF